LALPDLRARIRTEGDPAQREALSAAIAQILADLRPLRLTVWQARRNAIRTLGFADPWSFSCFTKGISATRIESLATQFLARTREDYRSELRRWARHSDLRQPAAWDLVELFDVAPRWRGVFGSQAVSVETWNFVRNTLLDDHRAASITLDLEGRPGKSARPFAAPIDPPTHVIVSLRSSGKHRDVEEALHELGHAAAFVSIAPHANWNWRLLWHDTVQETFAFLTGRLVRSPTFLEEIFDLSRRDSRDYARLSSFLELHLARRHAARCLYEAHLHRSGAYSSAEQLYVATMKDAFGYEPSLARALEDIDEDAVSIDYLAAWAKTAACVDQFNVRFGKTWFFCKDSWAELQECWYLGGSLGPLGLSRRLGLRTEEDVALIRDFSDW
jgi:hypothetical protein